MRMTICCCLFAALLLPAGCDRKGAAVPHELTAAVQSNDATKVAAVIAEHGLPEHRDGSENSLLHLSGGQQTTLMLLKHGMPVNATNWGGNTPLHFAAYRGQVELIRLLLDWGAKVDARNRWEWTPLAFAVRDLLPEGTAEAGLSHLPSGSPEQRLAAVRALLAAGADPNAYLEGRPLLSEAIFEGHVPTVRALLDGGANPSALNSDGNPPEWYLMGPAEESEAIRQLLLSARNRAAGE